MKLKDDMKRTVFFDGNFVSEEKAVVPVTAHALHYGTGVFEGIRAYYSSDQKALFIFRMRDHYKRLLESCKLLFIKLPYSLNELCELTKKLVQKNFEETDIYIRPLAFKSDVAVGNFNLKSLKDSLTIYTLPMGRHLNTESGSKVNISSWRRIPDNAIPPRGKITGAYINTSLAKTESILSGYDEAILLDHQGHIVEGSAENVFLIKDAKLITPPVSDDILVGITRDTVIKICCDELKLEVVERSIDRSEIYSADELILVGTGAEISPVIEADGRKIGEGKVGEISRKIQDIYQKIVHGEDTKYEQFLTKVIKSQ